MPPLAAAVGGWAALSAIIGTAGGLAAQGYSMSQQAGQDKGPDPMIAAKASQDAADKARLRGVVGRSTPDALTRTSGGASNDFLANLATQEAGTPGLQTQALDMVKQLMNQGGV